MRKLCRENIVDDEIGYDPVEQRVEHLCGRLAWVQLFEIEPADAQEDAELGERVRARVQTVTWPTYRKTSARRRGI